MGTKVIESLSLSNHMSNLSYCFDSHKFPQLLVDHTENFILLGNVLLI
jgi:hypothetical protein